MVMKEKEELSQTGVDKGEIKVECNVESYIGFCSRKRTLVGKVMITK